MKRLFLQTSLCLFLSATALHPICLRAQSQSEMNQTAEKDFEQADAKLNKIYEKVLHSRDAQSQEKLKAAQRAWVQFRDAESALAADEARGGTMSPLLGSTRCAELTRQRTTDLEKMLKNE